MVLDHKFDFLGHVVIQSYRCRVAFHRLMPVLVSLASFLNYEEYKGTNLHIPSVFTNTKAATPSIIFQTQIGSTPVLNHINSFECHRRNL